MKSLINMAVQPANDQKSTNHEHDNVSQKSGRAHSQNSAFKPIKKRTSDQNRTPSTPENQVEGVTQ